MASATRIWDFGTSGLYEKFCAIADDVKLGRDVHHTTTSQSLWCEKIGDETRIGTFVEIQKGARVGARSKFPATRLSAKASAWKTKSSSATACNSSTTATRVPPL